MNLFQLGDFTLNSGTKSKWKLECDALGAKDIEALAEMIRQLVGPFGSVEGVPRGGLRLAEALKPFVDLNGPHLIVDDVLTTGGSMGRIKTDWCDRTNRSLGPNFGECMGAVIFARGQCPHWIKAVLQMPEVFWIKPRTR